ncbi:MAG TPA: BsuBI/PstI family type II restriction endonuclease [Candidatus Limnocylindria bacterium]|nr:BsuBI/PstI family type II restriction endonuclease [Candidatus Limnocylindria bacterium]
MPADKAHRKAGARKRRLAEAVEVLTALKFGPKQRNETAGYTLLALLNLPPEVPWAEAQAPLCGITPIIAFIAITYGVRYAPNTRETIRDDAVKFFTHEGLLIRNPDDPDRSTNSGKTVYQIEPNALALLRKFGTADWIEGLQHYFTDREDIKHMVAQRRILARVPVTLPDGSQVALSPGGQNPLIKSIIENFCPAFAPGGIVLYIGDTENKFAHLEAASLAELGVVLDSSAKIPDVIVHHHAKNWLLLIEAVTTAGPVDGKRRKELKDLFSGSKAGLVFVTAFETPRAMQSFATQIAWESEVWIAENPDHMIHFNGERFLGPYPDVTPKKL